MWSKPRSALYLFIQPHHNNYVVSLEAGALLCLLTILGLNMKQPIYRPLLETWQLWATLYYMVKVTYYYFIDFQGLEVFLSVVTAINNPKCIARASSSNKSVLTSLPLL